MGVLGEERVMDLWQAFADEFIFLRGNKSQTIKKYIPCLRTLVAYKDLPVGGYTPEILTGHFAQLGREGRKATTVDYHYAVVRSFFSWAEKRAHVEKSPFHDMHRRAAEQPAPRAVSWNEALASVENCWGRLYSQRDQACALLMLLTGARTSEVVGRRVDDLDLTEMTVSFSNTKGRKPRVVGIPVWSREKFEHYLEWRGAMYPESPWLFPSNTGEQMMARTFSKRFGEYKNTFTPYTLRHSALTKMIREGIPLPVVSTVAGHANVNTTMRYWNASGVDLREAAESLGQYEETPRFDWRRARQERIMRILETQPQKGGYSAAEPTSAARRQVRGVRQRVRP